MSLKTLQKQIENDYPQAIRLERTNRFYKKTGKRKESLHEFLIKFFTEWNNEKNTIYVEDKEIQTDTGRRRSLGDIFMICKYYYPDVTLEDVILELYINLPNYFDTGFRSSYCHTIHKRVWYYDSNMPKGVYNKSDVDEYGNVYKYYVDKRRLHYEFEEPSGEDDDDFEGCLECGFDPCECDEY